MVKRIISIVLGVILLFALAGCTSSVKAVYREDINVALDKSMRSLIYYEYIDENGLSPIEFYWGSDFYDTYLLECEELEGYSNKEISDALLHNYSYNVKDIVLQDDDTAICTVEITNIDMSNLYDKLVETLFALVMSENQELDSGLESEEQFLEKEQGVSVNENTVNLKSKLPNFGEVFMTTLYRDSLDLKTSIVSITLKGNTNSWEVQDTQSIVDTIYGGYFSGFSDLYSMYINEVN